MKITVHRHVFRSAALAASAALLAACSSPDPRAIDYQSTTKPKDTVSGLAVPPDVIATSAGPRAVAPVGGDATLSTYEKRATQAAAPSTVAATPRDTDLRIQRDGTGRWLVVAHKSPDDLWPLLHQFWQNQGFVLAVDDKKHHVMETDWLQSRAKLDLGVIRNTLSKAIDNAYVAAERNKYRTRLETAADGSTQVFISQQGMHEVLVDENQGLTEWRNRPNDPVLEADFLQRLKLALQSGSAVPPARAGSVPAAASTVPGTVTAGSQGTAAEAATPAPGQGSIDLAEPYDRAWLEVGLALERGNFTVDDRDRTRGLYYVRYVDPNDLSSAKQGFWSQVFHGKTEKVAKQYKINVRAMTETLTRVAVVDDAGAPDNSAPAAQILGLLRTQFQ